VRGDGDGWVVSHAGTRHWGRHGAAGLLLRAPAADGSPAVLLQHRAPWSHLGDTWGLPGGARDSHESPEEAALREAHEEAGLPAEHLRVRFSVVTAEVRGPGGVHWTYTTVVAEADRAEGGEAVHALLPHAKRRDFPTAFVTYNTPMAYGAALALQREGWNVPADLSLASADVSRLSIEGALRITGAGTSPDKLGETAARLVLGANMPDEGYTDLMLPGPLVIGNSTGPAPK
jgi:8-oxo-dGTP pyrophosphatase MutT (NUDIX family)